MRTAILCSSRFSHFRKRAIPLLAWSSAFAWTAAAVAQQPLKTLTLADYPRWSRIADVQLSGDGKWMTYGYAPNEGDGTLYVRDLTGTKLHTITRGSAPVFSDDSRWVAYTVNPPGQSGGGRGGRGGGAPGGGRGQQPPAPGRGQAAAANTPASAATRTLELLDLQSGEKVYSIPEPQTTTFSADSRFLAVRRNPATSGAAFLGADLVLRNLSDGTTQNIGNVASFAFNKPGSLLAYIVDAASKNGNGLYLLDLGSSTMRVLDADTLRYDRLTWNADGTRLAVLRGETPKGAEQRVNALATFTGLRGSTPATRWTYAPASDVAFPKDMVLSELGTLEWSRDGARIFVGAKQQKDKVEESAPGGEAKSNVEIWHWADDRLLSLQKVQAEADRRSTYAGAINVADKKFVPLADADMPRAQTTRDGRWAIAQLERPYRRLWDEDDGQRDLVRVNTATGERSTLVERVRYPLGASPDGKWHVWFKDGKHWTQDIATGTRSELSATTNANFINVDSEGPGERGSYGIAGWSRDGKAVLVNGRYDLWQLPLVAGGKAVNLTNGMGERERVRFRLLDLRIDDDDPSIDTSKPILLSAFGDLTKKSGYFTVAAGQEPRPLIWQDRSIGALRKAKNADRVIFTAQTFEEFPDWWTNNAALASPTRVTDANPQQKEYKWGKRVLVDYTDKRGNKLQATLTLPSGYEQGTKYPMLVYFYERLSQNHHQYSMPTYDDRPHMSTYASDGYLVLMPDIVYDVGKPGSSALDDVTSAVKKVVELGYADPARIGAQGHSWGGYESSYIVTQTDIFAAVVTGAPLTNLESMHNILYKQSGGGNAPLIQWGQGRMGTTPFDDAQGYDDQSPVHHVKNIKTPFLILHGTADGAVDWNQGLEFYVAARRAGKQVILLSYPDEPHHLGRKENQKDFQVRMKQYFDHFLKRSPAPPWLTNGVPFLDRAREKVVTEANGTR